MKSIGIVRRVDELGRIVLPIELRRTLDIAERDTLEIFVDGDTIMLRKFQQSCIFCGSTRNIRSFKEKFICEACVPGTALTHTNRFDNILMLIIHPCQHMYNIISAAFGYPRRLA